MSLDNIATEERCLNTKGECFMKLKHWVIMAIFLIYSVFQAFAADLPKSNPSNEVLPGNANVSSDSDTSAKGGVATSNPTGASNPFLDAIRQRSNTQQTSGEAPKRNANPGGENPFKSIIDKK
jgi:hypothetical protein